MLMDTIPSIRVLQSNAQNMRKYLQSRDMLELKFSLLKNTDGTVDLPIKASCLSQLDLKSFQNVMAVNTCNVVWRQAPRPSKRERGKTSRNKIEKILQELLESRGEKWTEDMIRDIPHNFHRHGDLVLLGDNCFSLPVWKKIGGEDLWPTVTQALGAKRLAQVSRISRDGFRTPSVSMLFGEDSWVTHIDNGIRYEFDVAKSMFASGNITEKLRIATFDCSGETVVDLYAGIGYFTLPYLIHAGAARVHSCEWNPEAVAALRKNLERNGVSDRCTIHHGDNRQLQMVDIADRVNLGLLPSSEEGWPVACQLLRRATGGMLHIHHNVTSPLQTTADQPTLTDVSHRPSRKKTDREAWEAWANETARCVATMLTGITAGQWLTRIQHIEHVKSYAPRIHHVVLDLECRPL